MNNTFSHQTEGFKKTMLKVDEYLFELYYKASKDPDTTPDEVEALHTAWKLIVKYEIGGVII